MKKVLLVALLVIVTAAMTTACDSTNEPPFGQESVSEQMPGKPAEQTPELTPDTEPEQIISTVTIKGVEYSTSLTELSLAEMGLLDEDIAPLKYMVNLTALDLGFNKISDLTPLSELTGLIELHLGANPISDLSPLRGLANLTELHLNVTEIHDLTALSNLTALTKLGLGGNEISDLTPLSDLTGLTELNLCYTLVSDLTPLTGLANLTYLDLENAQSNDLTPLSGLINLSKLILDRNQIIDLSPLTNLTNLKDLSLSNNPITDWSPVAHVTDVWGRPSDEKKWQVLYAEFLQGVETYNYIEREHIIPCNYSTPPLFCLYDIDKCGTPELILISDDGKWENASCDVFSCTNDAVERIGSIKWNWFGDIGAPKYRADGLYSDDSYKGHYGILYCYTIRNNTLVEQIICEYNINPTANEKAYINIHEEDGTIHNSIGKVYAGEKEAYTIFSVTLLEFWQITDASIDAVITRTIGAATEVRAYNPFLIIDGQGYRTEYQPCENLNRIANTILGTPFGGQ